MGVTGVTGSGLNSSSPASQRCWQVPEMQRRQSPAAAQSEEVVQASPQVTAPYGRLNSLTHLCWHVPSMHKRQSGDPLHSELDVQASPQAAPRKLTSVLWWNAHLCWQVPEMQRRQSPALAQSEEVEQVSPHWAAALVRPRNRATASDRRANFLILLYTIIIL